MAQPKRISLANVGGGELSELADRELSNICENIADPNIKAEAVRELNITIKVKPDPKRQTAEITYQVKSKLPGVAASKTTAFIAMDHGELGLFGMDIRQGELPYAQAEPTVTEIHPVAETRTAAEPAFAPPMPGAN